MSDLLYTSDDGFQNEVLDSKLPVLVDFWAPWCRPCLMLAPIFEDLAKDYTDRVIFAKLNTDENPVVPQELQIQGIPTMILFQNGAIAARTSGARPKEALKAWVDSVL